MTKRLTVVYELPDDCDVTRITGKGELNVVTCVQGDAIEERDAARRLLAEANRRLTEIQAELYGKGLEVSGWHQNGALEPLDSWFEDNDWGPVESAREAGEV